MIAAVLLGVCFAQTVHDQYAAKDPVALRAQLAAAITREDSLLVRYRLYALTRERSVIAALPDDLDAASPRELALLSALWAWRIPGSAPWNAVRLGRRSNGLLGRARAAAPEDPLVWLIDAQSLIFRPGFAGGDVRQAIARLRGLRPRVGEEACGVSAIEVDYWLWHALAKAGDPDAPGLRERLLASRPPPLYVEMLDAKF